MTTLVVRYPVHDLEGNLLVPAGTVLSKEFMHSFVLSHRHAPYRTYRLLAHSSVQRDLLEHLTVPPYDTIFESAGTISEITDVLKEAAVIAPLLEILDYFRDNEPYTYRHMMVVYALSVLLADDLFGHSSRKIAHIATGHFHDLGKFSIPLEIINKRTPFTLQERDQMLHHTVSGYVLSAYYLGHHDDLTAIIARDHHERLNGTGHPRGLNLHDRFVEIVAVCDIYDALVSPRPYRSGSFDNRSALEVISDMAGKGEVSWPVVHALVARNRKRRVRLHDVKVSAERRGVPPSDNSYGLVVQEDVFDFDHAK